MQECDDINIGKKRTGNLKGRRLGMKRQMSRKMRLKRSRVKIERKERNEERK
jgi:hypothetical protein